MKILFLVPYPSEGASNRVRIKQFIPYLRSKGAACAVRPFINKRFFKILYVPHRLFEKIFWFIVCTLNRILDIIRAFRYDIVFIHREAYPLGGPFFETILHRIGKIIVFDFDDAIFLPNTSEQNIYIEKFKKPTKVSRIIEMSALVIAGNKYLYEYASRYNKNVVVIPSSVDADKYKPSDGKRSCENVVIGWIGSNTTRRFIYGMEDIFTKLSKKCRNVKFKIVGARFNSKLLDYVVNKKWSLDTELDDIRSFDIGIMPMPDNEWTKGKCGFKAILYMACGIPVVASPVGVNNELIEDDISGFFAKNDDDWVEKLSRLMKDGNLRYRMGQKGRERIIKEYSLSVTAPLLYEKLAEVYSKKG